MPYISFQAREISFKVVYFGPSMSGKTTNLAHLHRTLKTERKGELVSLNTDEERTLFFDFFPMELGEAQGYHVRFHLYTVPGQVYYEASRRLVLDGADAVVFVVDSARERLADNIESFTMLQGNLLSYGRDPGTVPIVMQYNKRDCQDPTPLGTVESRLGLEGLPVFQSVATQGVGVMETAHKATSMAIERFQI